MRGRSKDLQHFTMFLIQGAILHNKNEYTLFLLV